VTTAIEAQVKSWRCELRARNLAPKTIKTDGESADQLVALLAAAGVTTVEAVTREQVWRATHVRSAAGPDSVRAHERPDLGPRVSTRRAGGTSTW
jgi:hypothetical protein